MDEGNGSFKAHLTRGDLRALLFRMRRARVKVSIPELGEGVSVIVQEMTANERDEFESLLLSSEDRFVGVRAKIIALTCVDENGERIFSPADLETIGTIPSVVADRLFTAAKQISGLESSSIEDFITNFT